MTIRWSNISEHFVQFNKEDAYLLGQVASRFRSNDRTPNSHCKTLRLSSAFTNKYTQYRFLNFNDAPVLADRASPKLTEL